MRNLQVSFQRKTQRFFGGNGVLAMMCVFISLSAASSDSWENATKRLQPRIIVPAAAGLTYNLTQKENVVSLYLEKSGRLLVGGDSLLYRINFKNLSQSEIFNISVDPSCSEAKNNYLSFVGEFKNRTIVCGTNCGKPSCWYLDGSNVTVDPVSGAGMAPFDRPVKGDIVHVNGTYAYSTYNLRHSANGLTKRLRRVRGGDPLYTSDTAWKTPFFIYALTGPALPNGQTKLYTLFNDENSNKNPGNPSRHALISQVCVNDQGAEASLSAEKWTTFLKARLICSTKGAVSFPELVDVSVIWKQKEEAMLFGLFQNDLGFSAVCVYSINEVAAVFNTSTLKGYTQRLPSPRPGECQNQKVPKETFKIIDAYPETDTPVTPTKGYPMPVFVKRIQYEKIRASLTQDIANKSVTVLFLITSNGFVHKMIVDDQNHTSNILSIKGKPVTEACVDGATQDLFLARPAAVLRINSTETCTFYQGGCDACVLARDPFCAWNVNFSSCSPLASEGIKLQNITGTSEITCPHNVSESQQSRSTNTTLGSRYFFSCPVTSHWANYTFSHNGTAFSRCVSPKTGRCVTLLENINITSTGSYICSRSEDNVTYSVLNETLSIKYC